MMVLERTLACSGMLHSLAEFLVLTIIHKAAGYYCIHDRWDNVRRGQNNCFIESRLCFNGNAGSTGRYMRPQLIQVFMPITVLTTIRY